jgi:D-beta-D-heptose 7-phosphate kinase/D-beta-D-heptose 1-phosphate adenosyltransferase
MSIIYVLFTGGFDPIHSGHINAIRRSAELGRVIVAPNSDAWLIKKKGAAFQPLHERVEIISNILNVAGVLTDWDDNDGTACGAIKKFYEGYSSPNRNILLFANGGDRTPYTVSKEEIELCNSLGIMPIFNVGGAKTQSSSAFLQEWSKHI